MLNNKKENFPQNTLEQAEIVYKGWKEFEAQVIVPNFSLKDLEQKIEDVKRKIELAEEVRHRRSQTIQTRNKVLEELWKLTKRIRNSAKATFGDGSKEIQKFGGRPGRLRKAYQQDTE